MREGEGGVEGMGKGKLRVMARVRVSVRQTNVFDEYDEYDNLGLGCDFGQ